MTEDGQRRVGRQEAQKTQESDGTAQDGWRRAEGGRLRGSISGFFGLFWISVLTRFDSCKIPIFSFSGFVFTGGIPRSIRDGLRSIVFCI